MQFTEFLLEMAGRVIVDCILELGWAVFSDKNRVLPVEADPHALPGAALFAVSSAPANAPDLKGHIRAFLRYSRFFKTHDRDYNKHLRLKEWHTLRVFRNAQRIARDEAAFADPAMTRSLLLAALYHDIARFPQFSRYKTFSDAHSCNHGELGREELLRLGLLNGEDEAVRGRVLAAVCLHNRFALPEGLPEDVRLVAQALRDADKLDILRIMAKNLGPGKRPDPVIVMNVLDSTQYTPGVLEAVARKRLASFADMRTVTDFRLLLCGWLYDLGFTSSRRIAVRAGNLLAVAQGLPDTAALVEFKDRYIRDLRY